MSETRLEIIIGPMFSGKSTELITRVERYKYTTNFNKILLINHSSDNRQNSISGEINGEYVQTHSGKTMDAIKTDKLMNIFDIALKHDVIGIDEAQFFGDLLAFFKSIEHHNKVIIVAGLDGDIKRNPMGQILYLIPYANKVEKITAIDIDGTDAIFTQRREKSNKIIDIGGSETYRAVSRKNYPNFNKLIKSSQFSFILDYLDFQIMEFSKTRFSIAIKNISKTWTVSFVDHTEFVNLSTTSNDSCKNIFEILHKEHNIDNLMVKELFMFLLEEVSISEKLDLWKNYFFPCTLFTTPLMSPRTVIKEDL